MQFTIRIADTSEGFAVEIIEDYSNDILVTYLTTSYIVAFQVFSTSAKNLNPEWYKEIKRSNDRNNTYATFESKTNLVLFKQI